MYYASFPIQELGEKGDWDYNLKAVFCVGILDFEFDEENQGLEEVIHTVQLKNQHNQIFYDKLKFVYLEMPHFNKSEKELETRLDKWLYFIRHLEDFQTIPEIFKDEVFEKAFKKAELANYTKQERAEYEESLKTYRDLKGVIDTAFDEGKLEGKLEGTKGKLEIAKALKDKEQLGKSDNYRKAVYDIYCQNKNGEQIIVELQKAKQKYFKDRTMYYASFPIQELGEKGDWDYNLKAVFCVGILDFEFDEENQGLKEVIHTVQLKNQHNQIFYDKLKFVYLEMPHFNKSEKELETRLDKWLYFIRHLEDFQTIPEIFKDEVFEKAFKKAELANYTKQERAEYEESLKTYRDLKGVIDTAFDEGKLEGIKEGELKGKLEGKIEIAKALKVNGISIEMIVKTTGLSEQEVKSL
ncbi:hypothetical protein CHS0354_024122 [Potamilus streckersoni]|uniref:PD-(D/E)XK nuclease family transposase n=1 Tax=Potamilus streckersoni TaxID=2493646 RepID=A0AAE0VLD8_9BIVA|nr:hypothetical protein CHS0354_024122 [Potamilus streckersoni]